MSDNDKPPLPRLSHLQFLVLDILGSATMKGRNLRLAMRQKGVCKSGPGFYQLMARLEEAKFVEGWYEQKIVEGQIIKERQYKILNNGIAALRETRNFYAGTVPNNPNWVPEPAYQL